MKDWTYDFEKKQREKTAKIFSDVLRLRYDDVLNAIISGGWQVGALCVYKEPFNGEVTDGLLFYFPISYRKTGAFFIKEYVEHIHNKEIGTEISNLLRNGCYRGSVSYRKHKLHRALEDDSPVVVAAELLREFAELKKLHAKQYLNKYMPGIRLSKYTTIKKIEEWKRQSSMEHQ